MTVVFKIKIFLLGEEKENCGESEVNVKLIMTKRSIRFFYCAEKLSARRAKT